MMISVNKRKIIAVLLMICVAVVFTGCGQKDSAASSQPKTKLEQIKEAGKVVVGTSADYPPYEFHKEINKKDEIVGFDISIAKEIAKDLGVELEVKDMKFDGLLAALDSGNVDFVIAGMNPTPDRAKNVDFTQVYYTAIQSVVIRTEDQDKIKNLEDLKGKKVGAQKGATQEQIAKDQIPGAEVKALGKISDLVLELKNNKIDAIVVELPVANAYAGKNTDIKVLDIVLDTEDSGSAVAVKKGNQELVDAISKSLDRLMNDNSIDKFVTEATEAVEN